MAILMCSPGHFGIEYEINPWMHLDVAVDRAAATEQWRALRSVFIARGETVELVEPIPGLPDMVYTANAGVVWNRRVVLSRFRHPERQGEEPFWRAAFDRLGFETHSLDRELAFEGAGDALFAGDLLIMASGFRSDAAAHPIVATLLGVEHISVELIDPRYYHLDTCFCPLDQRTAIVNAAAFTSASLDRLRGVVPNLIEVRPGAAGGFGCNAMPLGREVVSALALEEMRPQLEAAGFGLTLLPMGEFMKGGGGVRCLSLPLDLGRDRPLA